MKASIARILESSFIDGPGHRAVVFMQGCDLACRYCHNPETRGTCNDCGLCVAQCPSAALSLGPGGRVLWEPGLCTSCDTCIAVCPRDASPRVLHLEPQDLVARLEPLEPFIDGVTFSGGECSLQGAFLLAAAPLIRALRPGLTVLADTNGNRAPKPFEALLESMDGFIFDLKAWDPGVHRALTGVEPETIRLNLVAAARAGKVTEVRTVLVPGINDDRASIQASGDFLASLPGSFPWRLIPFRPQGVRGDLASMAAYPREGFEEVLGWARLCFGGRALGPALWP